LESFVLAFLGIAIIVSAIYFLLSSRDTKGKMKRIIIGTALGAVATPVVFYLIVIIALSTGLAGM
jgi:ABC-type Fe3+-siderophore transport system permease subunit